jgi:flagellar P-ring protein precursor FlgI
MRWPKGRARRDRFQAQGDAAIAVTKAITTSGPRSKRRDHRARTAGQVQGFGSISSCSLSNPDFSTAVARLRHRQQLWRPAATAATIAEARDSQEVVIDKPKMADLTRLMAEIENLVVETDVPAQGCGHQRTNRHDRHRTGRTDQ